VQQALLRAQQTYRQGSHPSHPSHHPHPSVPTAPPPPHLAAQSLPAPPMPVPRGRSGVYIAAGVGVTAALVTVTTVGVYAAKQGAFASATSSGQTDSSKKKAAGVSTDVNGQPLLVGDDDKDKDEDDKDKDKDDTTPPSPIITKKDASSSSGKKAARYMCGSDTVETKRGGRYEPDPNMPDISEAVWVGGDCKATLEDCTIGGKNSVLVLGSGTLTLRRCRVQGAVKLVGDEAKLHLEGTTLPQAPEIVGKGKVIRH
jgi:hypothetical protein